MKKRHGVVVVAVDTNPLLQLCDCVRGLNERRQNSPWEEVVAVGLVYCSHRIWQRRRCLGCHRNRGARILAAALPVERTNSFQHHSAERARYWISYDPWKVAAPAPVVGKPCWFVLRRSDKRWDKITEREPATRGAISTAPDLRDESSFTSNPRMV
jgi:hypothetical protein